jgi:hypothetical protein
VSRVGKGGVTPFEFRLWHAYHDRAGYLKEPS